MPLEFVKSQPRKPKLNHEGSLYCLLCEKYGLKKWRCDKRQRKAIATTFEDHVFTTRKHLHEPDMKHSDQLKVLEKMKEEAENSNEQSGNLYKKQQQHLRMSVQWHCQNTRIWPEAFKDNVGGETTQRY